MKSNFSNWDEDLPPDEYEEYQHLVTSLERKVGFGLFFVQCTPRESEGLIANIPRNLPDKQVEVLRLLEPVDNLYDSLVNLYTEKRFDLLLIKGLEYSLYKYEKRKFGEITAGKFSNLTSVPPLLNHLNQQRERSRDNLPVSLVFLLRPFAINYLIHRAPDFFDWRSSLFQLSITPEVLAAESSRLILQWDYEEYTKLSFEEKIAKFLEIQELLTDKRQTESNRANLLFELGTILSSTQEYETAIATFDQSLEINPNYAPAWYRRGFALGKLENHPQALVCFQKAVKLEPNYYQAWFNWAIALYKLGEYAAAIPYFDQAVQIKDDYFLAWLKRGVTLNDLGRYPEAIASFSKAGEINPDSPEVWYNLGLAYAIQSQIQPALENFHKAIKLSPKDYLEKLRNEPKLQNFSQNLGSDR